MTRWAFALVLVTTVTKSESWSDDIPPSATTSDDDGRVRGCVDATKIAEDDLLSAVRSSGITDYAIERALKRLIGTARRERAIQLLLDAPATEDRFRCFLHHLAAVRSS